jgi:hypothetical protein
MKSGRHEMPLKETSMPLFFVALAITNWWAFEVLRWAQRNPLITFEPTGGFG